MAISLQKGGNVNLSKTDGSLKKLLIGLGWDVRSTDGSPFDLDASAFLLNKEGKVRSDVDFIFYNNLKSPDGSVEHMGDNLTGEGDGDDEKIILDLPKINTDIEKIAICVSIHMAKERNQNFGQVSSAYVRCVNADNNTEIAKYDLSEDASTETSMIFGEVYRYNGDWKFKAVGQGKQGGLASLAQNFGIDL